MKDVFIYTFESICIVTKKVYPTLSPHFPAWEFLNNSFLASTVQRDIETILRSPITLLIGTFVGVSLCAMDTFLRMLRQAPKWEFFVSRKRSHPSGPRAVFQGRFLCYHIQQLFFRNDHNLEYFKQWDWLHLHFLLGNTSVVQHVLSSKQIFDVKAELMALAHHEQQNGLSLSSKDLQDSGIYHSFIVKELSLLAELMQYCVDDANFSDASLLTPRMPKFFGYITFLDFWKLVCLWNARRFGNLAFSPSVYAQIMHGVEAQLGRFSSKFCLAANFLVVCFEIHTALVLEASIMILFRVCYPHTSFYFSHTPFINLCLDVWISHPYFFWNPKVWENKQRKPLYANLTT
ncbi:unnamed protein product [Malus baccata var. baccata]